jgi:hypothetical protein
MIRLTRAHGERPTALTGGTDGVSLNPRARGEAAVPFGRLERPELELVCDLGNLM